jgi:hypothetical protein
MKAYGPNGVEIVASYEIVEANAILAEDSFTRDENGKLDFDYGDESKVDWNSQKIQTVEGKRIFVDDDGNRWNEDDIRLEGEVEPVERIECELEPIKWNFTIAVTTRAFCDNQTIMAVTLEEAIEKLKVLDLNDYYYDSSKEGIEGDEQITLTDGDLDECGTDVVIDRRSKGEPFSWEACELVKSLAAINESQLASNLTEISELIRRARAACTINENGLI